MKYIYQIEVYRSSVEITTEDVAYVDHGRAHLTAQDIAVDLLESFRTEHPDRIYSLRATEDLYQIMGHSGDITYVAAGVSVNKVLLNEAVL